MSASLLWIPFLLSTFFQNIGQLLLLLITLSLVIQKKHPKIAGFALGLAALLKIWPFVLLVGLLMIKKYIVAIYGFLTVIFGLIISFIALGIYPFISYITTVRLYENDWIAFSYNYSLAGTISRFFYVIPLFSTPEIYYIEVFISILILLTGLIFVYWYTNTYNQNNFLVYSLLLSITYVSFPISWNWGLIIFLIVFTELIKSARKKYIPLNLKIGLILSSVFVLDIGWMYFIFAEAHKYSFAILIPAVETILIVCFIYFQLWYLFQIRK